MIVKSKFALLAGVAALAVPAATIAWAQTRQRDDALQMVSIDVEGGGATLFVTPRGRSVLIDTAKGPIRVAELKKNGFFGETAILCDAPRNATIKASESLLTLKISKDMFYRLVTEFPTMAIEMMRELAHRVEDTNQKLREATANKAA